MYAAEGCFNEIKYENFNNIGPISLFYLYSVYMRLTCICFLSNDNELSVESQRELDDDREHAEADARKYLEDKYHMDFEMNSFEPDIYMLSSDFKAYYDRIWIGEFTVDGKQYEIQGRVPEKDYYDNFQYEQIHPAYEELVMQNMPNTFGTSGVTLEVKISRGQTHFSTFYDGNNIRDLLNEKNDILIYVTTTPGTKLTEEFWKTFHKEINQFEEKYEGSQITIITPDN